MKKLVYILFLIPLLMNAQGELNNNPQQVINTPQQGNLNEDEDPVQQVQSNDTNKQKDKEPPCKDCEEIKKIKKEMAQHTSSGITSGDGRTRHAYFKKFRARTAKKFNRAFVRHKKNRPDLSCFNW